MDPRERLQDAEEAHRTAYEGLVSGLNTAMPCFVVNVYMNTAGKAMTVDLQPTVMAKQRAEDGTVQDVKLPLLVDVPVIFPGGGGFVVTFPIKPGDEALAIFGNRCIDSWWQSGGIQTQAEIRMHDLSDAFCLVGPRSQPKVIPNISTTTAQLRTEDGTCYVELAGGGVINIVAPASVNFTTPHITQTGDIVAQGDVVAGTISLEDHLHSDAGGTGDSGPPVP